MREETREKMRKREIIGENEIGNESGWERMRRRERKWERD